MNRSFHFLIFLFLIAGCDALSSRESEPELEPLIPLAVGNQWVTRTTFMHPDTGEAIGAVAYDTLLVTADTLIEGERWFRLGDEIEGRTFLATNREDGYWAGSAHRDEPFEPQMVYRYPAEVGDTFVRRGWPEDDVLQVMGLDTTITAETGTFHAVHYAQLWTDRPDGGSLQCDFFVAPGVGHVKSVLPWIDAQTGELVRKEVRELVSIRLN